jgi:hypothetical protein
VTTPKFDKLRGTSETTWQVGLGGPNLNANGTALEAKNAANSALAIMRGATPVGDTDLANKQYVDTLFTRIVVSLQFNGGSALPANTGTEQFYVVTTTGANATIGQLLWDDGTGVGTVTVLAAKAQMIVTAAAFTGGTITFSADSLYVWDTTSTSWVNAGGSQISGAARTIRTALTNAASQSSAKSIPANAIVYDRFFDITTAFSAGATLTMGQTGTPALLQSTTDNLPQTLGEYHVSQETVWGASALPVLVTVAGAPAAGAGFFNATYAIPDA